MGSHACFRKEAKMRRVAPRLDRLMERDRIGMREVRCFSLDDLFESCRVSGELDGVCYCR